MEITPSLSTPWSRRRGVGTRVHRIIELSPARVALLDDDGLTIHDLEGDSVVFHRDGVSEAVAWSEHLVLLEESETLTILDTNTGRMVGSPIPLPNGPDAITMALAVSSEGKVATAGDDRPITVHDLSSGKLLASWEDPGEGITALTFLPDGRLVSGGDDRRIRCWEPTTGDPLPGPLFGMVEGRLWGHSDSVEHLAPFSTADGVWRLAAADGDHTIRVWDLGSGEQIGEAITAHTSVIRALVVDGPRLVSVSTAGLLVVHGEDGAVVTTCDLGVTVWGAALAERELAVGLAEGWGTVALP